MRSVMASVDDLLAGVTEREVFTPPDGKSETLMERVVIEGERYVVKHLDHRHDWIMRITGDLACRPVLVWQHGIVDQMPECIDSAIVGAAWDGRAGAILMHEVGEWLLPEGDSTIPLDQHLRFLDHMAQLHAALWGWSDNLGLQPLSHRYLMFHHTLLAEMETAYGGTAAVPRKYVPEGWGRFAERVPQAKDLVWALHADIDPLMAALRETPVCFTQGDWKAGNLGSHPDGRTILVDWAIPGEGPPTGEIAWYVCLNRARLPQSKDDTLAAYRDALERHGIDTAAWWDRQLGLALVGSLLQFGWEKALGDGPEGEAELAWWVERALEGSKYL